MSSPVIKIENLSKVYRLGEVGTGTLSHDLNRFWRMNILGQDDPYAKVGQVNDRTQKAQKGEHISALRDINLEVHQGEVLGIIGKNGAGKSTLLKLLSRVTGPTTGSIKVKGRLASLLEVGTGFNPEMTGRENIYMNGTIMGMRRWEITRKLDEIVEFAGVAKYLDTPTKRYSSGMTVRLGFAIAAHLEPEILVVDEVLAVGDAEFQKKAIGKMQDVSANDGRTVLFVSHNMASVKTLCTAATLIENGEIKSAGTTEQIVEQYLFDNFHAREFNGYREFLNRTNNLFNSPIIESLKIKNIQGNTTNIINAGDPIGIEIEIKKDFEISGNNGIGIYFYRQGEKVAGITSFMGTPAENKNFKNLVTLITEPLRLIPNTYQIELVVAQKGIKRLDHIYDAGTITIVENDVFGNGEILDRNIGDCFITGRWTISCL